MADTKNGKKPGDSSHLTSIFALLRGGKVCRVLGRQAPLRRSVADLFGAHCIVSTAAVSEPRNVDGDSRIAYCDIQDLSMHVFGALPFPLPKPRFPQAVHVLSQRMVTMPSAGLATK